MQATAARCLPVGVFPDVSLNPGWYLYVGSARRGLKARLARHLRYDKKRRWHIDYLLNGHSLTIHNIFLGAPGEECRLAASLLALPGVSIPQVGLGASDCRCPAHIMRCDYSLSYLYDFLRSRHFSPYSPA